ncbi:hypothetical protein [Kitasatospora sp. NPDC006786]|uniref:hypothetical protein n=1 Tax=unclassified Kitasatospora TaxID=2633591 RepID=UPI00340D858C
MPISTSGLRRAVLVLVLLLAALAGPVAAFAAAPPPVPVSGATAGTPCPAHTRPVGQPEKLTAAGLQPKPPAEQMDARGGCVPLDKEGCRTLGLRDDPLSTCVYATFKHKYCDADLLPLPGMEVYCENADKEMATWCKENPGAAHCGTEPEGGLGAALKNPGAAIADEGTSRLARTFASAAKWVLGEMAKTVLEGSVVDLDADGISDTLALMLQLSAVIATILLCVEVTRTCVSHEGKGIATAVTGLVEWGLSCAAMYTVTQTLIWAADDVSNWMIRSSGLTTDQFVARVSGLFAGMDTVSEVGWLLVLGVVGSLVAGLMWIEFIFRHDALDLLVVAFPVSAAGAISEFTRQWAPTARKAVYSIVMIKPVVVITLLIGQGMVGAATTVTGVVGGLLVVGVGAVAWPVTARFMPFAGGGSSGGSVASGIIGAVGGTAASAIWGRGGGVPSGSGAAPPGPALARAVESDDADRRRADDGRRSSAGRAVMAGLMAAQGVKAGTELASGGLDAMAAHAGLGSGRDMGGSVNLPPSRSGEASAPAGSPGTARAPAAASTGPAPAARSSAAHSGTTAAPPLPAASTPRPPLARAAGAPAPPAAPQPGPTNGPTNGPTAAAHPTPAPVPPLPADPPSGGEGP